MQQVKRKRGVYLLKVTQLKLHKNVSFKISKFSNKIKILNLSNTSVCVFTMYKRRIKHYEKIDTLV